MEKSKKKKGLSRLFEIAGQRKGLLILAGLLSAGSAVCMLVPYWAVYEILKELLSNGSNLSALDGTDMMRWGWIAFGGLVGGLILLYAALMSSHVAAFRILYGLRVRLSEHIGKLPLGYLNNTSTGAIKKTMDQNIEKIEGFIAHTIPDLVNVMATVVVMLVIFFSLDVWLTIVCLAVVVLSLFLQFSNFMGKRAREFMAIYYDAQEKMSASAVQYVRGMPVVKIFGQSVRSFRQFNTEIQAYKTFALKCCDTYQNGMIAFTVLLNSMVTFILPMGILLLQASPQSLSLAVVWLFFIIMGPGMASPVYKLTFLGGNTRDINEGVNRIDRILEKKPVPEPGHPQVPAAYDVEFRHVSFFYENTEQGTRTEALRDVSFKAPQGKITALVGPSGSGKSTVANLIPRFWDVEQGEICIGGIDIRQIDTAKLMDMASFVFQDNFLFYDTFAERKINTLILVHTKALLDQWKSRLEEFLEIDFTEEDTPKKRGRKKAFSPFGTLDSKGNSLHGKIDIALMQSCLEDNGVKSFVRNYGMLIVDECHHVSAVNFERILKYANASYVYGLTATAIRKDGHQPIIFMQCGPIRYSADAKVQMTSQTFTRLLVPRFTAYRELTDDKSTYARMIQKMVKDENRNNLIIDDVRKTLTEGRSPIVLTNLTTHVETLANALAPYCKYVVTLIGSESAREKHQKMELLQGISPTEPLVIVATGKYVGEGFDYPRLDTLFLALPVSWKGIIAQYAGRLHREYPGKKEVRIYDYIDIRIPMCDVMYKRRLRGYASVGYQIRSNEPMNIFNESHSVIFNGHTYLGKFFNDLSQAKRSVVISATKLWFSKRSSVLDMLKDLLARGVEVIAVIRSDLEKEERLKETGANVRVNDSLAIDVVIIDKSLIWYGSVNYLGYNTDENNAICIYDLKLAENILEVLYT